MLLYTQTARRLSQDLHEQSRRVTKRIANARRSRPDVTNIFNLHPVFFSVNMQYCVIGKKAHASKEFKLYLREGFWDSLLLYYEHHLSNICITLQIYRTLSTSQNGTKVKKII